MIRCKFKVDEVTKTPYADTFKASPVYSDKEESENKAFWDATPSGSLEFTCVNKGSLDQLKPGQEFYLDLTPIEVGNEPEPA